MRKKASVASQGGWPPGGSCRRRDAKEFRCRNDSKHKSQAYAPPREPNELIARFPSLAKTKEKHEQPLAEGPNLSYCLHTTFLHSQALVFTSSLPTLRLLLGRLAR